MTRSDMKIFISWGRHGNGYAPAGSYKKAACGREPAGCLAFPSSAQRLDPG